MRLTGMAESHTDYSVGFNPTFNRGIGIIPERDTDYITVGIQCINHVVWLNLYAFQAYLIHFNDTQGGTLRFNLIAFQAY